MEVDKGSLGAAVTQENPEFLQQQLQTITPEYSTSEAAEASYKLADMEDTTSSLFNLANQAFASSGNKIPKEQLKKEFPLIADKITDDGYLGAYKIKNDRYAQRLALQNIIQNSPNTMTNKFASLMGSFLGAANGVDLAIGAAAGYSGLITPFSGALSSGLNYGASNLVENTISEVATGASQVADLQPYNELDAIRNIGQGTAIGQGFYGVGLGIKKMMPDLDKVNAKRSAMAIINDSEGKAPLDVSSWEPEPPPVPHNLEGVPELSIQQMAEIEQRYNSPENSYTFDDIAEEARSKKTDVNYEDIREVSKILDIQFEDLKAMVLNNDVTPNEFEALKVHKELLSEKNEIVKAMKDCLEGKV